MQGAQMMLVIGASMLLSVHIININRSVLMSDEQMSDAEYTMAATSIGQSLLHEIASKSFDEATVNDELADDALYTQPASLGPSLGESYPNFNDVDDFNGFGTTLSTPRTGEFTVRCRVHYVDPATPEMVSASVTHTKKIIVQLRSQRLQNPVTLTYYKSH
jgi:hypothetical protein